MPNELFVALYVYDQEVRIEVEAADELRLYRLEPTGDKTRPFETHPDVAFRNETLTLRDGVYGWAHDEPVRMVIDGKVTVVCKERGGGKDPWPPPPPPPPRFAAREVVDLWPQHVKGSSQFMGAVGGGRIAPAPRTTTTPVKPPKQAPAKKTPAKKAPAKKPAVKKPAARRR